MKMVLFTNYTDKIFAHTSFKDGHDEHCKWDNVPYKFEPGQTTYMEDWKVNHFAKHLVDRELNKKKLPTDHHSRASYLAKCIGEVAGDVPESKVASELANKNKEVNNEINIEKPADEPLKEGGEPEKKEDTSFCDKCDSKGRVHKKDCPKNPRNLKTDEENFEGLKE